VSTEAARGVEEGRANLGVYWDAAEFPALQRLPALPYRRDHLVMIAHAPA
jgi:hypothetical protein